MFNELRALLRISSLKELYRETPLYVQEHYLDQMESGRPWVPLAHFHNIGWRRNSNPSPFFDVVFYLKTNADVRRAGINPLVHYLEYGWKEGRSPHPDFDPRAFLWAHPDIDRNKDPATECIKLYGTLFWRQDPSSGSSSKAVSGKRPSGDSTAAGGQSRAATALSRLRPEAAKAPSTGAAQLGTPVACQLQLDELRGNHVSGWAWAAGEDNERLPVELWCGGVRIGHCLRRIKRPDVDRHLNAPTGTKGFLLPAGCLVTLSQLLGSEKKELHPTVRFGDRAQSLVSANPAFRDLSSFRTLRAVGAKGGWQVADLWWANSRLLKLRTSNAPGEAGEPIAASVRVFQPLPMPDGRLILSLVDELLPVNETAIATVGVRNPLMSILFVGYDTAGEVLFTDFIPFPSLLRGGLHEAEVSAVGEQGGTLQDFRRLSDAYLAEAAGWGQESLPSAIAEVEVDLSVATGGEPIFDPAVGAWLAGAFDVGLSASNVELRIERDLGDRSFVDHALGNLARSLPGRRRNGRSRLSLPSRGVPTVSAVVSRRLSASASRQPGPHIVADEAFPYRRYLVSFPGGVPSALYPGLQAGLSDMPYLTGLDNAKEGEGGADHIQPIAILFQDLDPPKAEALRIFPVPKVHADVIAPQPQALPIKTSVILFLARPDPEVGMLLSTVSTQVTSVECEVVLAVANYHPGQVAKLRADLEAVLPQRGQIIEVPDALNASEAFNQAAAAAGGEILLITDSSVILHDHRTVETLARIAQLDGIGTVGCMHLTSRRARGAVPTFRSAGYFPARVDFAVAPHLGLSEFDCSQILPRAIYPVVANSSRCFAVSTAAWRRVGGMSRHLPNTFAEVDLAIRLAESGYTNVCTTLLSVFTNADRGVERLIDIHAPANLTLWRMMPALKASTLIRAI